MVLLSIQTTVAYFCPPLYILYYTVLPCICSMCYIRHTVVHYTVVYMSYMLCDIHHTGLCRDR